MTRCAIVLCAMACLPRMAAASEPTGPMVADAVRLGTVATLAPLCGLRDDAWAEDLRRATVQSATGTKGQDDRALQAAPGHETVVGALFAEAEALEDFADSPQVETCGPLARNPDLARGDGIVRAFRARTAASGF